MDRVLENEHIDPAVLEKLEYGRVLEMLAAECRYSLAIEYALALRPVSDLRLAELSLAITAEAVELSNEFPDIVVQGARDLRQSLDRAEKGGRLLPSELLDVADTLSASRALRRSLYRASGAEKRFKLLEGFAALLLEIPELEATIARAISPSGDVLDTASEALSRIRREMRTAHGRLMDRLNSMVSGSRFAGLLQDSIITSRDGRYVIPVKSESRSSVPGVVHDTSSSGQTLFIEPLEIVELNNRWREAQIEESREIERVLLAISAQIGDRATEMESMVVALAEIDLANAKARLSFRLKANRPALQCHGQPDSGGHPSHLIKLIKARHPLLDPVTVVPIDISLGRSYRVLLITGPNTGGKTVSLKTVGLLALMAQSGLFIPAEDGSLTSVFDALFVDVGDEQSIQQSLSTFSSHMRNVIAMLAAVNEDSLVLLDELGAGTDPQEGSALARAIIESLLAAGPLVVATTHYSDVKAFAYETEGVENASVEFNLKSLAPTYRLTIGVPGQSNAVAIAGRLGMPEAVLERAREMIDPEEGRADRLIEEIMRRRSAAESANRRASEIEREAKSLRQAAQEELRQAEQIRHAAREEALSEAEAQLDDSRQLLRRLEREASARRSSEQPTVISVTTDEFAAAAAVVKSFEGQHRRTTNSASQPRIEVGDLVHLSSLDLEGEVLEVDGREAEVAIGGLRLRQPLVALTRKEKRRSSRNSLLAIVALKDPRWQWNWTCGENALLMLSRSWSVIWMALLVPASLLCASSMARDPGPCGRK